jgi:hypothetical protein
VQSDAFYEQGGAACTTWVFLMLTMIAHHMFVPAVFSVSPNDESTSFNELSHRPSTRMVKPN